MPSSFWLLVAGVGMGGGTAVTSSGGGGGWHPPVYARPARRPTPRVEPAKPTPRESHWRAELRIPAIRISARVAILRATPRTATARPTFLWTCPALRSIVTTTRTLSGMMGVPVSRIRGKAVVRDNARVRRQEDVLLAMLLVHGK